LSELFGGVDTVAEGLHRIQFAENLIEAAELAPSLVEQADDVEFLDALLGLGGAYAELEPQSFTADMEERGFFLDTLWQLQDAQVAATELGIFLGDFDNSIKILELLEFEYNLLQSAQISPELSSQVNNPDFINKLLMLGADYSGLKLPDDVQENNEAYNFINVLRTSEAIPLTEMPGLLKDITVKAVISSNPRWRLCWMIFRSTILTALAGTAVCFNPTNPPGAACFNAIISLSIELGRYIACLGQDDSDPDRPPIPPNDPLLLRLKQQKQRLDNWIYQMRRAQLL